MLENKYQARDILFSDLEKKGEQKLKKRIKNKKKIETQLENTSMDLTTV